MTMGSKFVVCIDSGDWPEDLVVHKIYRALPDDDRRIVQLDSGY